MKGLERIIQWHIEDNVLKRHPLSKYQHAFRPGHSCDTALSNATDYIESAIYRKHHAIGASLDIKGAFDNVSIDYAVERMKESKLPDWIIRVYEFYLRNRHSTISLNGISITIRHTCGTPQGGVLGPLIWSIVFDKILILVNSTTAVYAIGFADDIFLICIGTDPKTTATSLQKAIDICTNWGPTAGLTFSPSKTQLTFFTKTPPHQHSDRPTRI